VISPQIIQDYRRLFVNRPAYTLQSARPHPETGRHYYFTPKKVGTGAPVELTEVTIRRHLDGEITIGLYAINPDNQRCKWLAIDADYQNAMEDLLKLQYRARVEQARWASLDFSCEAAVGERLPCLHSRHCVAFGSAGEGLGSKRGHRGVSQARLHRA